MTTQQKWTYLLKLLRVLGVRAASTYLWRHSLGIDKQDRFWIRPTGIRYPLCVRRNTSDMEVFKQIFVEREYETLRGLTVDGFVLDCGANVGYSSACFLSCFPRSTVVAVEPDSRNFAVLRENLGPYGGRAKAIQAAVWSEPAALKISQQRYRDGAEWATQVAVCGPGETPDVEAVDINSLLVSSGFARISLLKMDVEGAEAVIFSKNYQQWLDRVDAIAIELHDDSSFGNGTEIFHAAIEGRGFQLSRSGELTICRKV